MNLTFGICWIEDQASDPVIDAVKSAVRSNGFEPDITIIDTEENILSFAKNQEHFQDFALILLDLALGQTLKGDQIAPDIRRRFRSTPILFYSAQPENNLRTMIADKRVDGVYCAHRERLSDRVGELVSDLSPALNRLSGMRGLAAGVVAECDQEFREILRFWAGDVFQEADLVTTLKERACNLATDTANRLDKITSLEELLRQHAISSALLFREVISRSKKLKVSDSFKEKRNSIRSYENKVLKSRNELAHGREEREPNGWRIRRPGNQPDLTVHDFQSYRTEFLVHLKNTKDLRQILVGG